jgi:hypothetical protein
MNFSSGVRTSALLFMFTAQSAFSQVDGFWLITNVNVGTEVMTPLGKWMKMEKGKATTGNGWQQHTVGKYNWNKKASQLSFMMSNEPLDEFGPFKVAVTKESMTWTRTEDGDLVTVNLIRITELPANPADRVKGLWAIREATENGKDVLSSYDPNKKMFLFIRWDRVYVWQQDSGKKEQGYWFMNGHRLELKLINDNRDRDESWTISFEGDAMKFSGTSENVKNRQLVFVRLNAFPK